MRKIIISSLALLVSTLPALADWKVNNGSAMIETDGSSAITLTCDNNANTNNKPGWMIRVESLNLNSMSPRTEMVFSFPGHSALRVMGDNRNGAVSIDSVNLPSQSEVNTLISRLKAANRVTVTLVDDASGNAMAPLHFNLRGSSKAISQVSRNCH